MGLLVGDFAQRQRALFTSLSEGPSGPSGQTASAQQTVMGGGRGDCRGGRIILCPLTDTDSKVPVVFLMIKTNKTLTSLSGRKREPT